MKKAIITLMLAGIVLIPAFSAYADLIVEPENDFYSRNQRSIILLERSFCVNSSLGSTSLKKEPGARTDITQVENGETIYVTHSCLYNGEYWGITSVYLESENRRSPDGWIKMDDLLLLYDYIAFAKEHYNEFYKYEGDFEEINNAGEALVWLWPGAGTPPWKLEGLYDDHYDVTFAYKDDAGREWGFITYLYGSRNIWICISDPINPEIPAFNPAPPPIKWVPDLDHINIVGDKNIIEDDNDIPDTEHTYVVKDKSNIPVLIIILVIAVVAGTFALIKILWTVKKSQ